MKKIEINQMEKVNGGGWGTFACVVVLIGGGAALGGPGGALIGSIASKILCSPTNAY